MNLRQITQAYRILGLSLDASLEECRKARNQLMKSFHPDKHPQGWQTDSTRLEERVHYIQEAYRFILENYPAIQELLKPIQEQGLSQKTSKSEKSHWVYTQIKTFTKD